MKLDENILTSLNTLLRIVEYLRPLQDPIDFIRS